MATEENVDLLNEMCSDPNLQKIFQRLENPTFNIPEDEYEEELGAAIKLNIPTLVNISNPDDYQTMLQLITKAQMCRERVVEITRHVYAMKHRWQAVHWL